VFACICRAVTCEQVTAAIDDGAATLKAVAKATRACTSCGTCRERIVHMLAERTPPCVLDPAAVAVATAPAVSPDALGPEILATSEILAALPGSAQALSASVLSAA
jgi:bacterioferritin-associated ferredoxin